MTRLARLRFYQGLERVAHDWPADLRAGFIDQAEQLLADVVARDLLAEVFGPGLDLDHVADQGDQ